MRLLQCKFINIQQSTKTRCREVWKVICVSLSISNRVLKPVKVLLMSRYGVSLSISNRVLKLSRLRQRKCRQCKFINIQQSTKTICSMLRLKFMCKFINIQQSTKTETIMIILQVCVSLSISNRVLKLGYSCQYLF